MNTNRVIPAKVGIHNPRTIALDSRLRGNDGMGVVPEFTTEAQRTVKRILLRVFGGEKNFAFDDWYALLEEVTTGDVLVNVSLSPEVEAWLQELVASGRYHSVNEAIVEAIRLLEMQDEMDTVRLKLLREEVGAGIDQLDKGLGIDGERFLQELRDSRQ